MSKSSWKEQNWKNNITFKINDKIILFSIQMKISKSLGSKVKMPFKENVRSIKVCKLKTNEIVSGKKG